MTFHPYVAAVPPCSGKALSGSANLQQAILERFDKSFDYGIYNCRALTTDKDIPSIHSDGRAGDVGFPVVAGKAHAQGFELVDALKDEAWDLGIMGIIYNRLRWSAKSPGGGKYTGPNPHTDHVHWEQTPGFGAVLSLNSAFRLIGEPLTLLQARLEVASAWHTVAGVWMTATATESRQVRLTRLAGEVVAKIRTAAEIAKFAPPRDAPVDPAEQVPAWVLDPSIP